MQTTTFLADSGPGVGDEDHEPDRFLGEPPRVRPVAVPRADGISVAATCRQPIADPTRSSLWTTEAPRYGKTNACRDEYDIVAGYRIRRRDSRSRLAVSCRVTASTMATVADLRPLRARAAPHDRCGTTATRPTVASRAHPLRRHTSWTSHRLWTTRAPAHNIAAKAASALSQHRHTGRALPSPDMWHPCAAHDGNGGNNERQAKGPHLGVLDHPPGGDVAIARTFRTPCTGPRPCEERWVAPPEPHPGKHSPRVVGSIRPGRVAILSRGHRTRAGVPAGPARARSGWRA